MWANYADKHTGVCLKFSGDKLDRQIRKELDKTCQVFCGNVEYNDQMLIDSTSPGVNVDEILKLSDIQLKEWLGNYFESNYEAVFLKKSKDWESEYEFRWLIHSEENKDEFISISDALEEVIVGSDFPETEYPILFKFCKDLDIPFYKMVWNNGIPDRKNLSALIYQKEKSSMPGHQRNIRNLVYFECDSMRELYDSMKTLAG
jgi:hypothetical protein